MSKQNPHLPWIFSLLFILPAGSAPNTGYDEMRYVSLIHQARFIFSLLLKYKQCGCNIHHIVVDVGGLKFHPHSLSYKTRAKIAQYVNPEENVVLLDGFSFSSFFSAMHSDRYTDRTAVSQPTTLFDLRFVLLLLVSHFPRYSCRIQKNYWAGFLWIHIDRIPTHSL